MTKGPIRKLLLCWLALVVVSIHGCGVDTDGDGEPDSTDVCPLDPDKTQPGECGCGVAEGTCDDDCLPNCSGQQCGEDGCGGSCGECDSQENCVAGKCVAQCVPDCTGVTCGEDGCGGSCGECDSQENCDAGKCVAQCVPDCTGITCGEDGCGGSCGECGQEEACVAGQCEATSISVCDTADPDLPPVPAGLTFRSQFGTQPQLAVATRNIWAVWWYPQFDHAADAQWLLDQLDDVRCRAINDQGLEDPPNPGRGFFYNVYIHHGSQDDFPNGWANGQGTDQYGNPFLTLPNGAHLQPGNINHEGFHVFQYSANSPGFAYSGDSQWYIESAAQWYSVSRDATAVDAFVEAGAIDGNPHLALWHSFSNEAPGDPKDWMFQVRQYGMHTYLYFLTEVAKIRRAIISEGFYAATNKLPQRYIYDGVGGDRLRNHFADWAAHNTADFDYLLPAQVERARQEVKWVGDPNNIHPYVAQFSNQGTAGDWLRPPNVLTPRGWSYNVVRIDNSAAAQYHFYVRGDEAGSEGAPSHFEARIVVVSHGAAQYSDLDLNDGLEGNASVSVDASATEVYLVIAAVPEHFRGNQTYSYEYKIEHVASRALSKGKHNRHR